MGGQPPKGLGRSCLLTARPCSREPSTESRPERSCLDGGRGTLPVPGSVGSTPANPQPRGPPNSKSATLRPTQMGSGSVPHCPETHTQAQNVWFLESQRTRGPPPPPPRGRGRPHTSSARGGRKDLISTIRRRREGAGKETSRNTKGGWGTRKGQGAPPAKPAEKGTQRGSQASPVPRPPADSPQRGQLQPVPGTAGSGLEVRPRPSPPSPARAPVPWAAAAGFLAWKGWGWGGWAGGTRPASPAHLVTKDWPRGGPSPLRRQPESGGLFRAPSFSPTCPSRP